MATMAVFTLLDLTKVFSINSYVYLATLGLVVTLVVAVIASLFGQPKYYGRPGWSGCPPPPTVRRSSWASWKSRFWRCCASATATCPT
ncbi:hypothetical protein M5E87_05230 [Flavonifractor plautii]|nr:hypothetical protein M5E87_05230 [Flavonifractor plautii]